jgi:predicted nucleotidyltransferase
MSDHEKYKKLWRVRKAQSFVETQTTALKALFKAEKCASILKSEFKARRVFLIGSLADGFFKASSDIDLVVEGLDDHFYFKALCKLHQIAEDFDVDLIPFEDYKYQDEILQGGILFDEASGKWENNPADRYYS